MNNNTEEKKIRVALYIRVSTEEQKNHGYGTKMQLDALKDAVEHKTKYNNWINSENNIYTDEACSGADLERPAFRRMMEDAKNKKFDMVTVWKIDRLSRSLTHLLHVFEVLEKNNISFYSLKESIDFSGPIGRLTFQIFGALAEFERETIKMRTTEGIIASLKSGNFVGKGIPFGYKKLKNDSGKGNKLIIVEKEAHYVKKIFEWFVFDHKNYQDITKELNKIKLVKGESSRANDKYTKWYDSTVSDILSNATYVGKRRDKINGQEYITDCPKIVDDCLFLQAQYMIEEVSRTKGKKGGGYIEYLLSRKLVYKATNRHFIGYKRTDGKLAYRHKVDVDKEKGGANVNVELPAYFVEDYVWEQLVLGLNKPNAFFDIYKRQNIKEIGLDSLMRERDMCENIIKQQEEKKINIFDKYMEGQTDEQIKIELSKRCDIIIDANKLRIDELDVEIKKFVNMNYAFESLERYSKKFGGIMSDAKYSEKKILVDLFIDSVEIDKDDDDNNKVLINVGYKFDPEYIENRMKGLELKSLVKTIKKTEIGSDSSHDGGC